MKLTKQRLKEIIKEELNEISFFGQDIGGGTGGLGRFKISKQDLVDAGLPLELVRRGHYDLVIARLERVGARRGIPALQAAVRKLRHGELNNPRAVLGALEREL